MPTYTEQEMVELRKLDGRVRKASDVINMSFMEEFAKRGVEYPFDFYASNVRTFTRLTGTRGVEMRDLIAFTKHTELTLSELNSKLFGE